MQIWYLDLDRMWTLGKVLMLKVLWMVRVHQVLVIDRLDSFLLPANLAYGEELYMARSFVLLVKLGLKCDARLSVDFLSESF